MTSVLSQLPLSYTVRWECRRYGSASAVNEPNPTGRPATPRVRLHLKPGQKGTKQLLAQYGDRLICVRYRYDALRKKRFKTVELLVAERDWEPRPRFADDQIVGLRVAFADVAVHAQACRRIRSLSERIGSTYPLPSNIRTQLAALRAAADTAR